LWKDLKTGKETALTTGPLYAAPAAISASGSRMAFALFEDPKLPIYAASTSHGSSAGLEKLCDDCGIPIQWSPDENRILCARRGGTKLFWLEVSSHRQSEAAALPMPSGRLRLSPDDRWLVFGARLGAGLSKLVVARASEAGKPTEPIPLTDGRSFDLAPEWAPNGNLVYFLSDRDGFRCLWAMRLNPASKQPIDVPFAVAHFHAARRSAMNVQARYLNLSVGRDKAVFVLSERTGNIWMAELETR
jgi:Tol biopolymer transport system component